MLQNVRADYLWEQTINNSLNSCWPFVIIITMKCVQSWSFIWKKWWYTWMVGHSLNEKNNSKVNKSLVKFQLFKCYLITNWNVQVWNMKTINKPSALDCGLERGAVQIPTFAKLYIDTVGFIFIFCSCVIYRCLNMCKNNPPHVSFQAVCSILVLQHFKCSSTHKGGGTLESGTQDSAHYGKGVPRNSVLHF